MVNASSLVDGCDKMSSKNPHSQIAIATTGMLPAGAVPKSITAMMVHKNDNSANDRRCR